MKMHRLWGLFLRYYYNLLRSYDRLTDMFFWPVVDLLMWGLTSQYLVKTGALDNTVILALLGGIMLWIFPWRGQYEITVSLLEDLWNRNLVNLFATPVKFMEWVVTLLLIGVFKAIVSFGFASLVAILLYQTNIYTLGIKLLPWAGLLIVFGWVFGLLVAGIIMRYGTKIQTLAWTAIHLVSPFIGVYYSIDTLPSWAQTVSRFVPASYVFEAMRSEIAGVAVPLNNLLFPFVLCVIYLALALWILTRSYLHILKRGLISVE
ncbi:ABC transporter permease [Candidatus Woesebacteria bacterium]|nr:ABC transporter permease [Candidatus Woesebacteria bacterium]